MGILLWISFQKKINFTEIRYNLKAQMAIKPRHIMLYYGLEQKYLNMGP